jgi:hypothetical protein
MISLRAASRAFAPNGARSLPGALVVALVVPLAAGAAFAQSDLQKCRALTDTAARLACYDAIPLPSPWAPAPAGAPAAGAPGAAGAVATPLDAASQFGRRDPPPGAALEQLDSSIRGRFEGWKPGEILTLANGQGWQVIDGSSVDLLLQDPKVVIRRAAFGSFLLEVVGTNRVVRVRRVR